MEKPESIKEQERKHYALKARRVRQGADRTACCGSGESISCGDPITSNLYRDDVKRLAELPAAAAGAGFCIIHGQLKKTSRIHQELLSS